MKSLEGWRTYLVFGATCIVAVAAKLNWTPADSTLVGQVVDFVTGPIFLSVVGLIMRKISTGPAAL